MVLTPENIYISAEKQCPIACRVLAAQHRFYSALQKCQARDPRTGDIVPTSLEYVFTRLGNMAEPVHPHICDRFADIVSFAKDSVLRVLEHPRRIIRREVVMTPVQKASRLNTAGIAWLNRQPGNTRRQKLLGCRQGIPAVQCSFSLDTAENRLLKRFVCSAYTILEAKEDACNTSLQDDEDALMQKLGRWLREEDVQDIRHLQGAPLNNAILGDANYNRIWRAWNRMTNLEKAIETDCSNLLKIETCHAFWYLLNRLRTHHGIDFPLQACFWNEDELLLHAGSPISSSIEGLWKQKKIRIFWGVKDKETGIISFQTGTSCIEDLLVRSFSPAEIKQELARRFPPVPTNKLQPEPKTSGAHLIDFCSALPWYVAHDSSSLSPLPISLVQQIVPYQNPDNVREYLPLNHTRSTCAIFSNDDSWLSVHRLLDETFPDQHKTSYAAYVAEQLKTRLEPEESFVYLLPDAADDFSLRRINVAISQQFPQALPLPTSEAAILGRAAQCPYRPGSVVCVIQHHANGITITPMQAESAPNGHSIPGKLVWIHHPSHFIDISMKETVMPEGLHSLQGGQAKMYINSIIGKNNDNIGNYRNALLQKKGEIRKLLAIDASKRMTDLQPSPETVAIGAKIYRDFTLQHLNAKGVTLWRHHLPPLLAQFEGTNCILHELSLVDEKTTINPRELHTRIQINKTFTLRANLEDYTFPLEMGIGSHTDRYEMYLHSPRFPLARDETCHLELHYTYGAAEPYEMYFLSADSSWRVKVEWREVKHSERPNQIPDAPQMWEESRLRHWSSKTGEKLDLIQRLFDNWDKLMWIPCKYQKSKKLCNNDSISYFNDKDGNCYTILMSKFKSILGEDKEPEGQYYIQAEAEADSCNNFHISYISCELPCEKIKACLQSSNAVLEKLWSYGRCYGKGIPEEIENKWSDWEGRLKEIFERIDDTETKIAIMAHCLRMGKDAPDFAVNYLTRTIIPTLSKTEKFSKEERRIFFAIGDCSCEWQQQLWNILLNTFKRRADELRVWILARVLWREASIIYQLKIDHIKFIINDLSTSAPRVLIKNRKEESYINPWYASSLEVMLAILRLRGSDNEDLRQALALNSPLINKMYYRLFQRILKKLDEAQVFSKLDSRLEISLPAQASMGMDAPPLIYTLRCYLTGKEMPAGISIDDCSDMENS